jgi:hypothetical protein
LNVRELKPTAAAGAGAPELLELELPELELLDWTPLELELPELELPDLTPLELELPEPELLELLPLEPVALETEMELPGVAATTAPPELEALAVPVVTEALAAVPAGDTLLPESLQAASVRTAALIAKRPQVIFRILMPRSSEPM